MLAKASSCCLLSLTAALSGCLTVTTVNIGTKTSLERQLIGELEPLTEEQLLAASVRAEPQMKGGAVADLQAAAVAARRRQLFNRDDITQAKQNGCLGEGRGGELAARPCKSGGDADAPRRQAKLIEEENQDRDAIIDWAVAADSALTSVNRPEVARVYHRLMVEAAKPGEWLQNDDGTWVEHKQ